jgi:hypothetical protein
VVLYDVFYGVERDRPGGGIYGLNPKLTGLERFADCGTDGRVDHVRFPCCS